MNAKNVTPKVTMAGLISALDRAGKEVAELRERERMTIESLEAIVDALKDRHHDGAWSVACCTLNVLRRDSARGRRRTQEPR